MPTLRVGNRDDHHHSTADRANANVLVIAIVLSGMQELDRMFICEHMPILLECDPMSRRIEIRLLIIPFEFFVTHEWIVYRR